MPNSPSSSSPAAVQETAQPAQLTLGTSTAIVSLAGSDVIVGSETLGTNSVTTINGQQVSKGSSDVVVGTGSAATTIPLDPSSPAQQITLDSQTFTVSRLSGNIVVGSQNLTIGGSAKTIGGGVVSAGSSIVVIDQGSTTLSLSLTTQPTGQQVTIKPMTIQVSKISTTVIVVGSNSLTVGGSAQTIDGQVVSAGSGGLIVGTGANTTTIPIVQPEGPADVLTLGSLTMTRSISDGGVEILGNDQTTVTLSAGGSAFTAGPGVVSVGTDGLDIQLSTVLGTDLVTLRSQILTRTQLPGGVEVLSDAHTTLTLSPGGSATIFGHDELTAAPSGLIVNMGSTTVTFPIKNGTVTSSTSSASVKSTSTPVSIPAPASSAHPASTSARLQSAATMPAGYSSTSAAMLGMLWALLSYI